MLLWDVDTQVDFITPGGRLYVPGAERIVPNLRRLTQWAGEHGIPVISSADAHQPGDPELRQYGPHCMAGTPGQQKIPETLLPNRLVVPNRPIELPELHAFQQIILEKQAFDVFTNPNADRVLRRFGENLSIVLYGVVTEICVACAVRRRDPAVGIGGAGESRLRSFTGRSAGFAARRSHAQRRRAGR